jgi:transcription termination factor NusB
VVKDFDSVYDIIKKVTGKIVKKTEERFAASKIPKTFKKAHRDILSILMNKTKDKTFGDKAKELYASLAKPLAAHQKEIKQILDEYKKNKDFEDLTKKLRTFLRKYKLDLPEERKPEYRILKKEDLELVCFDFLN